MDVPDGQFETIDDLFGETRIVTDVCLDTREDLLCLLEMEPLPNSTRVLTFKSFDLHTGELKATVEQLSPATSGFAFNPVDGKVYMVEAVLFNLDESLWTLVSIDPVSGELHKFPPFTAGKVSETYYGEVILDYQRGVLWHPGQMDPGFLLGISLQTGQPVKQAERKFPLAAYNPATATIFCWQMVLRNSKLSYDLIEFDPVSGDYSLIRENVLGDSIRFVYSTEIDPVEDRIYVSTDLNALEILALDGRRLGRTVVDKRFSSDQFWRLYRKHVNLAPRTRVSGKIGTDELNTCLPENSQSLGAGVNITFEPGGFQTWTSDQGIFHAFLPDGVFYTADFSGNDLWRSNCPQNPLEFQLSPEGIVDRQLDYVLEPTRLINQADVSLAAGQAILGSTLRYSLKLVNSGTVSFSGTLVFSYDERLVNTLIQPAPDRVSEGQAEWDIDKLPLVGSRVFNLSFKVPALESMRGVDLCARADILDRKGELAVNAHGRDEVCIPVRGSLDPNDIGVSPRGLGEFGSIGQDVSRLAYTIRFQNIGDAPAREVVILDTLDDNLNFNSLHFGAASHDYSVNLFNGRILEFRFDNINLPGVEENEAGSHGLVKFSVDLNDNLPLGTSIENRAGIYFDFNAPVITNTVVNTIADLSLGSDDPGSSSAPELRSLESGQFVPVNNENTAFKLTVYSLLGRHVLQMQIDPGDTTPIDLSHLARGRYLVRIDSKDTANVQSIFVVR